MLEYNPLLTQEQFCTNKFFEVKVEFLATLVKNIYYWDASKKKNVTYPEKNDKLENQKIQINHYQDDEEEEEQPKSITIAPTPFNKQPLHPTIPNTLKLQREKTTQKVNVFPKTMNTSKHQQPIQLKINTLKYQNVEKNHHQPSSNISKEEDDEQQEFVSRKQFNETLQLLLTVNQTVNNMVDKFNNFQSSVLGWVNNINAKVSIMDENIKIIKANL